MKISDAPARIAEDGADSVLRHRRAPISVCASPAEVSFSILSPFGLRAEIRSARSRPPAQNCPETTHELVRWTRARLDSVTTAQDATAQVIDLDRPEDQARHQKTHWRKEDQQVDEKRTTMRCNLKPLR